MTTPEEPEKPEPPAPGERYKLHQKTLLRKSGEAMTKLGQGTASLTAIQTIASDLMDGKAAPSPSAVGGVFFLAGLVFIAVGVYLQMEADR